MTVLAPVVLAGGGGTRLWPLSRLDYPKQLLNLRGERTLLQDTVARLAGVELDSAGIALLAPLVVANEEYRFLIADQLADRGMPASCILIEPEGRNTAPALTLAALQAVAGGDDPVLIAMPADHAIDNGAAFRRAVVEAVNLAEQSRIVTFGVIPDSPRTGYGYIRAGSPLADSTALSLAGFVEKPDALTAASMLAQGGYLWNAGIFVMRAEVWLATIERLQPEIIAACRAAFQAGSTDGVFFRLGRETFSSCPANSVDCAVMEHLRELPDARAGVVPLDAGWSDIGTWDALADMSDPDSSGNVLRGDVVARDIEDSLVLSTHRLVAAVGLRELVVVETADAVLIADKRNSQSIKSLVEQLNADGREEGRNHLRVYRPWGSFEQLDVGPRFKVKRLVVKPGAALSLQMHHHRAEHWVVVKGTASVTRGTEQFLLTENQSTYLPLGMRHRLENPGTVTLEVIEVQSGAYLGEDDIVRFEDRYRRDRD